MNLSPNFTFEELTNTSHSDLLIPNRNEANAYLTNLTNLAIYILQPLRNILGKPIHINSGYRGKALNEAVGGSKTSQHCFGEAVDIIVDGMSAKELFEFVKANKDIFTGYLGQAILELVNGKEWVHLSLKTDRYKAILVDRYGSDESVFLTTTNGKSYERVA